MKSVKILSALSLLAIAGAANAEVSGSMGIASSYLWRGYDLGAGAGVPAVSGDLHVSAAGFYSGIWGSSGDHTLGTEYDLYAGYGGSAGAFTYDISYWTYSYPAIKLRPANLSELVVSLGVGPVSAFINYNVNAPGLNSDGDPANGDYQYYGVKAKLSAFTVLVGHHNDGGAKLTHADLSYAYNDNLSFTVSVPVDVAAGYDKPADPTFVASYSVPFGK
ncbi:MAG: TorF family putative porin [Steroidobacteraceae bacterium]